MPRRTKDGCGLSRKGMQGRKGHQKVHLPRELPQEERSAVEEGSVSFGAPGIVGQVTGSAAGEKLGSFDQEGE